MGERFGNYEILRRIAAGGMAEVFLAKQTSIGGFERLVCIKRILSHLSIQDDFIKMFQDEARIAANLIHPNVAQIYDIGQVDGALYIAMEYVRGEDFRRVYNQEVARGRAMPPEPAAQIILGAAMGLDYAHRQTTIDGRPLGIVHRDISPQNILITYDGHVKVVDFGVAKAAGKMTETRTGVLKGKYSYMSPEQASGDPIDARTDIFALGITLYEVTTGTRLFKRDNEIETLHAVIECKVTPPSEVLPDYDPELERVVMRALAFDPDTRFQSAGDLARELEQLLIARGHAPGASSLGAYMQDLFAEKLADELLFGGQPWEERMTPSPQVPGQTRKVDPPKRSGRQSSKPTAVFDVDTDAKTQQFGEDTVIDGEVPKTDSQRKRRSEPKSDWTGSASASQTATRGGDNLVVMPSTEKTNVKPMPKQRPPWFAPAVIGGVGATLLLGIILAVGSLNDRPQEVPHSGELVVESEPRDARVVFLGPGAEELNKRYADKGFRTPFTVAEGVPVQPGLRARFIKDGFDLIERDLPPLAPNIVPEPLYAELVRTAAKDEAGTFILISNPPGAEVFINGNKAAGKTPLSDIRVKGGDTHKVEFVLRGYQSRSETHFVEPGGRRFVEVSLFPESKKKAAPEPAPEVSKPEPEKDDDAPNPKSSSGRSYLSVSSPVKLKVSVGSKFVGETPLKKVAVESGNQKIKLESDSEGFTLRKKIRLVAGKTETLDLKLDKGNLALNATPWAWVKVGKMAPSETPVRLSVFEGEYDVVFECPDGKKKVQAARVSPGQTAAVSVNCRE